MRNRNLFLFGMTGAILAVTLPPAALATDRQGHVERDYHGMQNTGFTPVLWLTDGLQEVGGTSILYRGRKGIAVDLHTTGLHPNWAFTVWWVGFGKPKRCAVPYKCGEADLSDPATQPGVFFGGGRVADQQGQASFAAQVHYGELPRGEDQVPYPGYRESDPLDQVATNRNRFFANNLIYFI